jgi:hypothetical protein
MVGNVLKITADCQLRTALLPLKHSKNLAIFAIQGTHSTSYPIAGLVLRIEIISQIRPSEILRKYYLKPGYWS